MACLAVLGLVACCQMGAAQESGRRLQIGMVLNGPSSGQGFATSPLTGLERAVHLLGVHGIALTPPVKEGYLTSLTKLARERYDLVFAIGGEEADDVLRVTREYPRTRFAIIDVSTHDLRERRRNLVGLVFTEQQAGYLAGYLAALMEDRRPKPHVVSTVGGFAFVPPVQRYIAGFQAGARRADPGIRLLNGYSHDFVDPEACRRVALGQIARGSGVVFQVAGRCGVGALEAARDSHVWGVGVDDDQSPLGPSILTSALKRWDNLVFRTIRRLQAGTLPRAGDVVSGFRDGGVGLGRISPRVPRAIRERVEALRRALAAGEVRNIPAEPIVR
jgi:basic membrane protein A and related proteins